jgi:hypothetical protein
MKSLCEMLEQKELIATRAREERAALRTVAQLLRNCNKDVLTDEWPSFQTEASVMLEKKELALTQLQKELAALRIVARMFRYESETPAVTRKSCVQAEVGEVDLPSNWKIL